MRTIEPASIETGGGFVDGNGVRLLIAASGRPPPAPRLTGRELVERVVEETLFSGDYAYQWSAGHPKRRMARPHKAPLAPIGGRFAAPPSDQEVMVVAQQLDTHKADVVLVALGCPKQELWSDALARNHAAVYCSIGGAVDTVAGERKPPPTSLHGLDSSSPGGRPRIQLCCPDSPADFPPCRPPHDRTRRARTSTFRWIGGGIAGNQ